MNDDHKTEIDFVQKFAVEMIFLEFYRGSYSKSFK